MIYKLPFKHYLYVITLVLYFAHHSGAAFFPLIYPKLRLDPKKSKTAGKPLILTPYLKAGSIAEAQNLSRVPWTDQQGFKSHAGFFTIDDRYNSNLYFWYFTPFSKNESAPVLLWLQGGPGASSLLGLFLELGPISVKKEGFFLREFHWALDHHLIFIDNPVGTGFSFTENKYGYCYNENCVARGLYNTLIQFFQLFPNLCENKFFITGESYAGKYIPSLGMTIHNENHNGNQKINLQGLAIGNGFCDPVHQLDYGHYLYQHGMLDNNQLTLFLKYQKVIIDQIKLKNWLQASVVMDRLMNGGYTNFSYFKLYTGFDYFYNVLQAASADDPFAIPAHLLQNDKVRSSLHVGGLPFNDGEEVQFHLSIDVLQSVAPVISELLSYYRILFYNGQLDIVVAYPLTLNFLYNLNFSGKNEYLEAPRRIWKVKNQVAGYVKSGGNLTEILVRNAGHLVPRDQPLWALDMIRRFVNDNFVYEEAHQAIGGS